MLKPRFLLDRFVTPAESYYGPDSIKAVTAIRNTRTFIVTIDSLVKSSHFERLISFLRCDEHRIVSSPFAAEPTKEELVKVLVEVEEFQPDVLIAVGGGSILDGGKLIRFFYEHGDLAPSEYERTFPPGLLNKLQFYAVPTTCGTGSEVSSSAILKEDQKKRIIVTHDFLPNAFILDPGFLYSLPESIKIETAADALTHAIEGYVSRISHPLMDVFAVDAVRLIRENLIRSIDQPDDPEFLLNLQIAATLAGFVQNHCLVGVCHAISHALGKFGISHGYLNLALLNDVIDLNSRDENVRKRYNKLSATTGFCSIDEMQDFISGIKQSISKEISLVVEGEDLVSDSIIQEIMGDKLTFVNPVSPDATDIKNIIERFYANQ